MGYVGSAHRKIGESTKKNPPKNPHTYRETNNKQQRNPTPTTTTTAKKLLFRLERTGEKI